MNKVTHTTIETHTSEIMSLMEAASELDPRIGKDIHMPTDMEKFQEIYSESEKHNMYPTVVIETLCNFTGAEKRNAIAVGFPSLDVVFYMETRGDAVVATGNVNNRRDLRHLLRHKIVNGRAMQPASAWSVDHIRK